eukprot:706744-Prymnesium_polylepis.1
MTGGAAEGVRSNVRRLAPSSDVVTKPWRMSSSTTLSSSSTILLAPICRASCCVKAAIVVTANLASSPKRSKSMWAMSIVSLVDSRRLSAAFCTLRQMRTVLRRAITSCGSLST